MKQFLFLLSFFCVNAIFGQNNITGTWNNDEVGTLVLNANGNGTFAGGSFTYTNTANKIFASSEQGDFTYSYKIVSGQLILSGGIFEAPVTFTKSKSNSSSANTGSTKSGSVDKSIVGTWCWINTSSTYTSSSGNTRCIVI